MNDTGAEFWARVINHLNDDGNAPAREVVIQALKICKSDGLDDRIQELQKLFEGS